MNRALLILPVLFLGGCGAGLDLSVPNEPTSPSTVARVPVLTTLTDDIDFSLIDANFYAARKILRVGNQLWVSIGNLNSTTWVGKIESPAAGTLSLNSTEGKSNMCCWGSSIDVFDGIFYSLWWEFGLGRLTIGSDRTLTILDSLPAGDAVVQTALGGYHRALDMDVYDNVLITTPYETPPATNKVNFSDISNTAAPALLHSITDTRFGNSDIIGRVHGKYLMVKSQDASILFSIDMSTPSSPVIADFIATDRDEQPRVFVAKGGVIKGDVVVTANWVASNFQSFRVSTDGKLTALSRLAVATLPYAFSLLEGDYYICLGLTPKMAFIIKVNDNGEMTQTSQLDLSATSYSTDIHCLPDSSVCLVSGAENFPHVGVIPLRFE